MQEPLREMETLSPGSHRSPQTEILNSSEHQQKQTALSAENKVPDLVPDNIGKPCFHQWDHTLIEGGPRFCSIHGIQEYPAQLEPRWMRAKDLFSSQKDVADKLLTLLCDNNHTKVSQGAVCEDCTFEMEDLIQQVIMKATYQGVAVFLIMWKPLYMFESAGKYPLFEYEGTLRQRQELKNTPRKEIFTRVLPAEAGFAPSWEHGIKATFTSS